MTHLDVLVLGSTGPIGRAMVRNAESHQVRLRGVSRSSVPAIDVEQPLQVAEALELFPASTVVYLVTPPPKHIDDASAGQALQALENVLVAAENAAVTRFLYVSSAAVYGTTPQLGERFGEQHALLGESPYARLKQESERLVATHRSRLMSTTSIRVFNVYGPDCDESLINGLISGSARIWNSPDFIRDYVHVDDVANILIELTAHADTLPEVINLGTGIG
ncbi:MAG: NAD-dependent epimerase/dehydratase family protein, partial [Agromyces sp.]